MALFALEGDDVDPLYRHLRIGSSRFDREIRDALESLWQTYEPYADEGFVREFARDPEGRFWEMYLTTQMLQQGKNVRPRAELKSSVRSLGPDIRIVENGRTIWIEAVAPTIGDPGGADQVPEIVPINRGGGAQQIPRRQVELRVSSALFAKTNAFRRYADRGLVMKHDICVIAISGIRFFAQSAATALPAPVTVVYPLGDRQVSFDRETGDVADLGYSHSEFIEKTGADPIPRYAFLDSRFVNISGLIWSRRTIGNFANRRSDLSFVPNVSATRSLETGWIPWPTEYIVEPDGKNYQLRTSNANEC